MGDEISLPFTSSGPSFDPEHFGKDNDGRVTLLPNEEIYMDFEDGNLGAWTTFGNGSRNQFTSGAESTSNGRELRTDGAGEREGIRRTINFDSIDNLIVYVGVGVTNGFTGTSNDYAEVTIGGNQVLQVQGGSTQPYTRYEIDVSSIQGDQTVECASVKVDGSGQNQIEFDRMRTVRRISPTGNQAGGIA